MAQKLNQPVALICTSGSAVYNYAPAISEAFYSNTPLIILSADRPPEWIDQRDGQTIRQTGILESHVLGSYELPDQYSHDDVIWHAHRIMNDACNQMMGKSKGPVHVNVPLREPFYPEGELPKPTGSLKSFDNDFGNSGLSQASMENVRRDLNSHNKILVVVGQSHGNSNDLEILNEFVHGNNLPVITDIISNHSSLDNAIRHHDLFLGAINKDGQKNLQPDLLITLGRSVISKNLKLYLRTYKPKAHWHITDDNLVPDTFQSLTQVFNLSSAEFLTSILSLKINANEEYLKSWQALDTKTNLFIRSLDNLSLWELPVVNRLIKSLPENCQLHLANSMPVRWANFINSTRSDLSIFANRGTSGIDGCLSTAVGCALATEEPVVALLGDMSFIYDRNGLWHNYLPSNLRIVVLNNQGGGIFKLIAGPSSQPELEEIFVTTQKLTAVNTVKDFDMDYVSASTMTELENGISFFLDATDRAKLLEVHTDSDINQQKFQQLKTELRNHLNE